MGILDKIKADAAASGSNRSKIMYFPSGTKKRVRFLSEIEDGTEVKLHTRWEPALKVVCREHFNKPCEFCEEAEEDDTIKTRSFYAFSIWDYDDEKVKIFFYAVNRCSPLPGLVSFYETYGTICDRDYVITKQGKGFDQTWSIVPMDKVKFRNTKAKPYSDKAIFKILTQAFPYPAGSEGVSTKLSEAGIDEPVDDDYDSESGNDYDEMNPLQLFKLCKERDIEAEKKKPKNYYINLLKEADKAEDDWGDEGESDDDEWEDEDE